MTIDDTTRKRLRRLGVTKGLKPSAPADKTAAPAEGTNTPVDAGDLLDASRSAVLSGNLPGAVVATPLGDVWVHKATYHADYRHGKRTPGELDRLPSQGMRLLGAGDLGASPAFFDTETTGLAGGAGTLAFLTGIGIWQSPNLVLHLVFMRSPEEEPAAMHYISEVLAQATSLVSFNGRAFDAPLLETRFIINRMVPLWTELPHLDLLNTARTLWREHLPSRRLGVLETDILGIRRTGEDIPGAEIPWLYREYLRTGDTRQIARIFYHNEVDVLSLATLLAHIADLLDEPDTRGLAAGEWAGLGRFYERAGMLEQAEQARRCALSGAYGALDPACAGRLWKDMSSTCKRNGAWDDAVMVWQRWAEALPDAVDPLVERAMYAEWQLHDPALAVRETDAALERLARWPKSYTTARVREELLHRKQRLAQKLEKTDEG